MKTIYKISLLLILYLFSSNISAQDQIDDLFFYINDRYGEGYVVVMGQTVTKANLTIPEEVVIGGKKYKVSHIGEGGFHCNRKIKSVVLPKSLLNISEKAFEQCENLTKIVFNENLKSIERDAFYRCTGLTQITLPSSIKYISYDAFSDSI